MPTPRKDQLNSTIGSVTRMFHFPIEFFQFFAQIFLLFSWCVLFSHPSDFTPVCTTELGRLAVHQPHFVKRNVKLLAHSVDDLTCHVDWVNVSVALVGLNVFFFYFNLVISHRSKDIKSYCLDIVGDFPYPIIADANRDLAVQLDMIDEQQKNDPEIAKTVRALYIISPDHKLRLTMMYPMSTGRNVE